MDGYLCNLSGIIDFQQNRHYFTCLSGHRHRHARVTAAAAHKPLHAILHRFLKGRVPQTLFFMCGVPRRQY